MDDRAAHRGSVNLDSVNVDAQAMRPRAEDESHGGSAAFLERRFKLGAALGQGGMGTVQRGVDRRLLRSVAVKVIHRHLNWGRNQKRFAREAQVIAQLEHPHIVPVYSFEESETGATAIVMRMIDGRTLHTFLRACRDACERGEDERPPYDLSTRLEYLIKACDAIQYAHDRGVIHRDLKPANVMLGEHKEVYVVDWGLAAVRGEAAKYMSEATPGARASSHEASMRRPIEELAEEAAPLTRDGDVFGTPQYMSPEQARGDTERIGSASDQYALGVMLFEAVYLKQARHGHPSALAAAAEGQIEPPTHVTGRHVPRALRAVLERATAKAPRDRYPSVRAFAEDLRCVQRGDAPSVVSEPWLQRAWRRLNRDPVWAMRVVASLLALAFLVTTASLGARLVRERSAGLERRRIAYALARVGTRAQHVESTLARVEMLVYGWAKAAEQVLSHAVPMPIYPRSVALLRARSSALGLAYSARHGQRVSYRRASYVVAPVADRMEVQRQLGQLTHLRPYLRRWLRDPISGLGVASLGSEEASIPLLWIYASLESGVLVTYPGNEAYPDGFDPRERPWYRDAERDHAHHWRAPYLSVTSGVLQLPCTRGVFDARGGFVGVVGMDLAVHDLRDRLQIQGEPAWRESWLLDGRGRVLVDSRGSQTHPLRDLQDRGVELVPFSEREVFEQLREGNVGGEVEKDGQIFAYQRLRTLGWTLVASFDRDQLMQE